MLLTYHKIERFNYQLVRIHIAPKYKLKKTARSQNWFNSHLLNHGNLSWSSQRHLGLSESPQEVLVGTTNHHDCANGSTYRIYSRVCGGTFHLLDFLEIMTRKTPEYILKIAGISFGFAFAFVILEISARLLPATDAFSQKLPLKCKSPISNFSEVDEDCLFRRAEYTSGVYTKGKFPPFPVHANKTTNDIGQFSDVDFRNNNK